MKVLVVGSGGREHVVCWKLKQDPRVTELYCAPGNGGIASIATCVDIKATEIDKLVEYSKMLTTPDRFGMDIDNTYNMWSWT